MKRLTVIFLLVLSMVGCGPGSQKAAGWGLAGAGIGLTLYTTGNTINAGARGGVDGVTVGVQYGISAAVLILGAIVAGTARDLVTVEDVDKEDPRPGTYQRNREAALRQAILRDQKKNQKRDQKKSTEVTCSFLNSEKSQTCFSNRGHTCTGTNSCSVNVALSSGTELTWKSTCQGVVETTMGSKKMVASFNCDAPAVESNTMTEPSDS